MIDIKLIRENEEKVKENIRKKFQEEKIPLVDEVKKLDEVVRKRKQEKDALRAKRNQLSNEIGILFKENKVEEATQKKEEVVEINNQIVEIEAEESKIEEQIKEKMLIIPNLIMILYLLEKMIVAMLKLKNLENP